MDLATNDVSIMKIASYVPAAMSYLESGYTTLLYWILRSVHINELSLLNNISDHGWQIKLAQDYNIA